MRFLLFAGAAALLTGAGFTAKADVLSELSYTVRQPVADLSCVFVAAGTGYIAYDYAVATLATAADHRTVFQHAQAELTADEWSGIAPRSLCSRIDAIKAEASQADGYLSIRKRVTLSLTTWPTYVPGRCSRFLQESVAVSLTSDLILSSGDGRNLSATENDCR